MTHLKENTIRSAEIKQLLAEGGFLDYEMGIAIIDLNDPEAKMFGYNMDHFIYPASVYKIFVGAEVLRRIELGDFSLDQEIIVKTPNDVDKDARIFPGDTRKLMSAGDSVTVDYLLDLMLTRSDNTASNCLIDLVGRESITENIIYKNEWQGSEVTRKFLDRIKEEKPYQFSSTTMSCARHLAEFMHLVEQGTMISVFVSGKLKTYMKRFNRQGKKGLWLADEYQYYYGKGGWLETNLWKYSPLSLVKAIIKRRWAVIQWSNDAGVVAGAHSHYVIAVMSVNKKLFPNQLFPIQKLAKIIYDYMEKS